MKFHELLPYLTVAVVAGICCMILQPHICWIIAVVCICLVVMQTGAAFQGRKEQK